MKHKTFDLIEAKADGEAGQFSALASVFNNIDSVGDRVMPGAFAKTLERWRASGDPIPVVLSHQWDNPMAHVGVADPRAVVETDKGLLVQGSLDIADNATAKQVHKLMKRRSLKSFSFGYTVPDGGERMGKDGANELTEIDLVEIGPTLKGANPEAQLQAVKSALEEQTKTASTATDGEVNVEVKDNAFGVKAANGDDEEPEKPAEEPAEEPEAPAEEPAPEEQEPEPVVSVPPDRALPLENKGHLDVGPAARAHLHNLIAYYMEKPHPFTACVRDNTKRFGPDGAKRVCATLKDIGMGTTHWRHGGSSDKPEAKADQPDAVQQLYEAAGGDLEALLEMWHEHMARNGDTAMPAAPQGASMDPPLEGEALQKAIEESDRVQEAVVDRLEAQLKAERERLEAKWDGSASRYTDSQYAAACALDRADCGDGNMPAKQRYSLPYKNPGSSSPDPGGTHAAAQRLSSVDACLAAKKKAAAKLLRAYGQIGDTPPDSLREMAKDLPQQQEVETVESKTPGPPAAPTAKDPLKDEIDRLRLEIAVGKPLRR